MIVSHLITTHTKPFEALFLPTKDINLSTLTAFREGKGEWQKDPKMSNKPHYNPIEENFLQQDIFVVAVAFS